MPSALKPIELHVLLALADEPAHGYALVQRIERDSEQRIRPLPGNLYSVIRRLVAMGFIRENKRRRGDDPRRRYYELTPTGRKVLLGEARHLEGLVVRLRSRLLGPSGSKGRG
ncbi:MAG TPA: helix-turn-helix transcriptional regulator [Vicinamibacteria bacterium]|nr:helix-turn-helix transcriptional regulator [Vicinamibacteria bacterium]